MIFRSLFGVCVCALALFAVPTTMRAVTLNYTFTYANVADQFATVTSTGSGTGSFTITYTGVGAQPASALTAFSFSDTITESAPTPSSSSFTYNLSNVSSGAIVLGGSPANAIFADLEISTVAIAGSNANVGTDSFTLFFSGANPGDGSTQTAGADLGYDTMGQITLSPVTAAAVPEPSGLAAMGMLFGVGAMLVRRSLLDH